MSYLFRYWSYRADIWHSRCKLHLNCLMDSHKCQVLILLLDCFKTVLAPPKGDSITLRHWRQFGALKSSSYFLMTDYVGSFSPEHAGQFLFLKWHLSPLLTTSIFHSSMLTSLFALIPIPHGTIIIGWAAGHHRDYVRLRVCVCSVHVTYNGQFLFGLRCLKDFWQHKDFSVDACKPHSIPSVWHVYIRALDNVDITPKTSFYPWHF